MPVYDEAFVRRFMKPWNDHDVEGAMALMNEDCLWETPRGPEPHGTRFDGAAAIRSAIANAFKAMPDIRYELVRCNFGPDLIVLELLVTGTSAEGRPIRFQACDVMTMRDGKVAAKRSYRKVIE
ncbi:nuclear transport factor 2 family protein [Reyranella sp.]|uniref:nuclear transport factor 2 family protein n=1 Tax=Reyranella sp. TaxID=1929291 RepID=UPI00122BF2E9|nr:nuclear transport factor 2 family protein [Reyranella sp.]TAJ89430.1 MAG: nuclear transport factor 2 family protein [Reyranella sp.]